MSVAVCKGCYALGSACGRCDRCFEDRAKHGWASHEEALAMCRRNDMPMESFSAPSVTMAHLRGIALGRQRQMDLVTVHLEDAVNEATEPAVIDALLALARKVLA